MRTPPYFFPLILILLAFAACHCPDPVDTCVPPVPEEGAHCLLRLNNSIDGNIQMQQVSSHDCETVPTVRSTAQITLRVLHPIEEDCDESSSLFPDARLQAEGLVIHREDGLALFDGTFQLIRKVGPDTTVFFEGRLELIARIGTHRTIDGEGCNEACDAESHLEGRLAGKGVGDLSEHTIRAVLSLDMNGGLPESTLIHPTSRMAGVVLQAP